MQNNNDKKSGGAGTTIIAVILVLLLLSGLGSCTGGGDDSGATCGSCGRTFTDSGNTRSIAYKNMCKNCYSNFKWSQDALDGLN